MTKMEQAKMERLKQYPALVKEAEYLNNRIDQLQQSPFVVDSEVDAIDSQITKTLAELDKIQSAIYGVKNQMECLVLQLRYLNAKEVRLMMWKDIAAQIYGDSSAANVSAAKRLHERALKHLHLPIET